MTKITVIYRCCEDDQKRAFRPTGFSKLACLDNFMDAFIYRENVKRSDFHLIALHDGPIGPLHDRLEYHCWDSVDKINLRSNSESLAASLGIASGLPKTEIIYFLEDDYLHTTDALDVLLEGFKLVYQKFDGSIITLYNHPDRYTRDDDVDFGKSFLLMGDKRYWRSAESTTCTWAITQKSFQDNNVYEKATHYGLSDREFFRSLYSENIRLFQPMHGASTHCHLPFLTPFVNWQSYLGG